MADRRSCATPPQLLDCLAVTGVAPPLARALAGRGDHSGEQHEQPHRQLAGHQGRCKRAVRLGHNHQVLSASDRIDHGACVIIRARRVVAAWQIRRDRLVPPACNSAAVRCQYQPTLALRRRPRIWRPAYISPAPWQPRSCSCCDNRIPTMVRKLVVSRQQHERADRGSPAGNATSPAGGLDEDGEARPVRPGDQPPGNRRVAGRGDPDRGERARPRTTGTSSLPSGGPWNSA
jgi:hypothetical protein